MVEFQINELLKLGIIKPSKSEMGSPIVCVLKGKDGKDGVRIAVDYRYLNKYCEDEVQLWLVTLGQQSEVYEYLSLIGWDLHRSNLSVGTFLIIDKNCSSVC